MYLRADVLMFFHRIREIRQHISTPTHQHVLLKILKNLIHYP